MTTVLTTRDIPTLGGVIRTGMVLLVVSWGEDGSANLAGVNGWPRVSLAPADAFECFTTKTRRHEGESQDGDELQVVPVEEAPLDGKESTHVSANALDSDGGAADSEPITIPSATSCEPDKFPTCEPVETTSEVNTLDVNTSSPFVPPCLCGSSNSSDQPSAVSNQPSTIHIQERSHGLSNFEQLTQHIDDARGDRGRDSQSTESGSIDDRGDVREACPFDATRVSGLPAAVSRDDRTTPRSTVDDINAELAAGGVAERYQLTREQREQVRFARPVSKGRNDWPAIRTVHKTPEQLTIIVDPEAVGMPTYPRSSWHPRRGDWPEPWTLAEYGLTYGGRTVWCADHPELKHDDKPWRLFVDLDRGEFCLAGKWNRIDSTTKAQRHEEDSRGVTWPRSQQTTQNAGEVVQLHPVESCIAKESEVGINAPYLDAVREPAEVSLGSPFVSLCLCGENNFPEPHHAMTTDERRGYRRVRNERGDIVWRCGPGPGETFADFTAWRQRLDQFFETGVGG